MKKTGDVKVLVGDFVKLGDWRRDRLICRTKHGIGIKNGGQWDEAIAYSAGRPKPDMPGHCTRDITTRIPLDFHGIVIDTGRFYTNDGYACTLLIGGELWMLYADELEVIA